MDLTLPVKSHANEMLLTKLRSYDACDPACKWVHENGFESIQEAWNACSRADWMAWLMVADKPIHATSAKFVPAQVEVIKYCWEQVLPSEDIQPWIDQALLCREFRDKREDFCRRLSAAIVPTGDNSARTEKCAVYQAIAALSYMYTTAVFGNLQEGFSSQAVQQKLARVVRKHFPTAPEL